MLTSPTENSNPPTTDGAAAPVTSRPTVGDRLRRAAAKPRSWKAAEAAALALASAIGATLDRETAEEALCEVMAFAQVYRGASEALWIHRRANQANPEGFDKREHHGADDAARFALTYAANALYWHPLRQLIEALCVATLGEATAMIASQLGMSDGEGECRAVRRALRVCRKVLAAKRGAR